MSYPKFIIEDDVLIVGMCNYHKQLASNPDNVKGGGWWRRKGDVMTFHGNSHDFGPATFEDIQRAVAAGDVYTNPSRGRNIADKYKFVYDTQTELIPLN